MPIRPSLAGQLFDPDTINKMPRPEPLLAKEREMERWRVATELAQQMKMAGFGCQLSIPVKPH